MNKFLKILTLTGLTATLSITGYNLTNIDLNTNYKLNTEVDTEASDYVNKRKPENDNTSISFTESGENNVTVNENTMDEHNNPIVENNNSASVNPTTESLENNSEITPKTLEETEDNIVNENSNEETANNVVNENNNEESTPNSNLETKSENDTVEDDTNTSEITEFISDEKYSKIISAYAEIKEEIEELIEDSQKLAENAKNEQNLLSQEQMQEVQTKNEELNNLLTDVKDSINDLTCTLTGECSNLEEGNFYNEIIKLNNKINMLQYAMQTYTNPAFRFYQNPYGNIYGFSYYYTPNLSEEQENEDIENSGETEISETDESSNNINKTTFNLPNNLDTYGPTRRNIDTFFNTALLDENGMYNNFTPYGHMPYNNFGYGNYGYGNYGMNNFNNYNNSNYQNKNITNTEDATNNTPLTVESSEKLAKPNMPEEIGKKRPKFAKNIDTYTGKTMQGNINSMGGMKVTDYIKQKFNKWFNKKDNQEEVNNYVDNFIEEHKNSEETTTTSTISYENEIVNKEKQNLYW